MLDYHFIQQILLIFYLVIVIIGVFLGFGERRKIIIFKNYDDLGLTFLIPVSYFLIIYISAWFNISDKIAHIIALIVSGILSIKLLINTYLDNNKKILNTLLAFATKLPLGIIWMVNFINLLDPSGKTIKEKRQNRRNALVILTLLTPIIAGLIVNKDGSFFNPKHWIRRRRIGEIRDYL